MGSGQGAPPGRTTRRSSRRIKRLAGGQTLQSRRTLLSQTAEYALRAAAWIAAYSPEAPIRARDLSRATGIPAQYLSKILRRLVVARILRSQRGQGGGFVLARPPAEISFLEVLSAVEASPEEGRCAFGWGMCRPDAPCPLHHAWTPFGEAFRQWAATTTLAAARGVEPSVCEDRRREADSWLGDAPVPEPGRDA
ncbi:Putative HTH-type transcriptional regulator [Myxococcaceae bacterium]|nr:Putative HTH-type transcriptional regulator [Myxococcaceae bacterium]